MMMIIENNRNANLFIRNYVANPTVSKNGDPIGGTIGFIKSLQALIKQYNPNTVFVCWDGVGGSAKRKQIFSEYKAGRSPMRLNRFAKTLSEDEQEDNKVFQLRRLLEYLENLPIIQLNCEYVEADDLIAFLCKQYSSDENHCFVVSSDKDFIQLVDENVTHIRPIAKEILTVDEVKKIYAVHPNNFCVARSAAGSGDKSDNIKGVPGVGFKTLCKYIPEFTQPTRVTLDKLMDLCDNLQRTLKKPPKMLQDIRNSYEILQRNLSLICLLDEDLSNNAKTKIFYTVDNYLPNLGKVSFLRRLNEDGLNGTDFAPIFSWATNNVLEKKKEKANVPVGNSEI